MENRINIAELLKDCPQGMELDCTMIEGLEFDGIVDAYFSIRCRVKHPDGGYNVYNFTEYGCWTTDDFAKCVIYPKGKTTWEGFVPPCRFKDGDIIADNHKNIAIYKGKMWYNYNLADFYCGYRNYDNRFLEKPKKDGHFGSIEELHLATEEEKQKLFDVIKENGYKWNEKTKTLDKLVEPKFHEGQLITDGYVGGQVISIEDNYSCYKILDFMEGINTSIPFTLQDNYHLWTIQDAKDGDVLSHSDSASNGIFIFKEILQLGTVEKVMCYCDYDSEDGFCLGEYHTCCWADSKILHPATKEQRKRLFQKMKKSGYEWDAEKKELIKEEVK